MKAVIIGAGEVGFNLAKKMSLEGKSVIVIEQDFERWKYADEALDAKVVLGSGSDPSVFREIDLQEDDLVMAVTDRDEVNMVACYIAGRYSASVVKVARIRNLEHGKYPEIFGEVGLGIDICINPEELAAQAIYKLIQIPGTTEVIDFADGKVKLIGVRIEETCPVLGKALFEFRQANPSDKLLIAAIHRRNDVVIPTGNDRIMLGDTLFIIVQPGDIASVMRLLGRKDKAPKRLMLMGGGYLGFNLARMLEQDGLSIKIIEKNQQRCERLSENLGQAMILLGDGTDQSLLEEESIAEIDMFVALTSDDEANILASLQAKQYGVDKVLTLINKTNYIPLVSTIGVDIVISPRLMTVSKILQFVRKGIVLSVTALRDDIAEAIEFIAVAGSAIVGKPLKRLGMPKGAIVGALLRGDAIIIPSGDDEVQIGDRVFIFCLRSVVPSLENLISSR
ncbi:MAG: hypothetical protein A2284_05125 [Deltaproteobacteria bacterium RIFOXYA12_FULL_61_11]|nr:MAG: hypothetical protein A2284_05125 [Deltaproteobacteria bacterium RIFOXYA12_FULL_61_11]